LNESGIDFRSRDFLLGHIRQTLAFHDFVDHRYGAWFRILSREIARDDDGKSCDNKADYHTMGACYEVLDVVTA
jgi:mannose/cellobiose epimerase-like protein (N-acyl-D-glucosamine 2-epimerase family)